MIETINKLDQVSPRARPAERQGTHAEEIAAEDGDVRRQGPQHPEDRAGSRYRLETPIGDEGDTHFGDFIEDKGAESPANATAYSACFRSNSTRSSARSPNAKKKVLRLRFRLGDGYPRTLEEVGSVFNVTRERVRQIEAKALRKMRHPTRSRRLKNFLAMTEGELR